MCPFSVRHFVFKPTANTWQTAGPSYNTKSKGQRSNVFNTATDRRQWVRAAVSNSYTASQSLTAVTASRPGGVKRTAALKNKTHCLESLTWRAEHRRASHTLLWFGWDSFSIGFQASWFLHIPWCISISCEVAHRNTPSSAAPPAPRSVLEARVAKKTFLANS